MSSHLQVHLPSKRANPPSGDIFQKYVGKNIKIYMLRPFTAALPVMAHDCKQPKGPTIGTGTGRINCCIHAMEPHEAVEGNEEEPYVLPWREQQDTLLTESRRKRVYYATIYLRTEGRGIKIRRENQNLNLTKTKATSVHHGEKEHVEGTDVVDFLEHTFSFVCLTVGPCE